MITHFSFEDATTDERTLRAFINKDGYLFIATEIEGYEDCSGFVLLNQQELDLFIQHLQKLRDNVSPSN